MNTILPLCFKTVSKTQKRGFFIGCFIFLFNLTISAQGPGSLFVDAGPDITTDCSTGSGCANITATFLETFESISLNYTVSPITYNPPFPFNGLANSLNPNIDDAWSPVDNLPFDFCFFENIETEFQVGSNGVIRFDVDPGDVGPGSNGWSFSENLPNNSNSTLGEANVFTPGHDIDPSVSNSEEIGYEVLGTFPNRVLVVSYYEVPMFSSACNSLLATQMVVFYEFSNVIEIYIQDKPSCPSWNSGNATLGIQNNDGNIAFVPPGRNTSDSPWATNNEAWRFSPAGVETYVFEWVDSSGIVIGTDPTIEVCPNGTETYTARVTYSNCNGEVVVLTDDVDVTVSGVTFTADLGGDQILCDTPSYDITAELNGVDPTNATFLWSTGETTQTITVTTTDVYSCDITADGCTITESVAVTFLTSPCVIEPVCSFIDFEENFGTGTGRVCDLNGATTTFTCNTTTQVDGGQYVITNTSTGLNTGWHVGMEDHTEGDVNGRMLFVNANTTGGEFYRRTITLDANEDYVFNAWITTVYDTDTNICTGTGIPSNVLFRIEDPSGTLIQEVSTGDIPNGPEPNWQQFSIAFNTGANTDIQLVLIDNIGGVCGNDLAIDDITLTLQNAEPQIVAPNDLQACDETGTGVGTFDLDSQISTILNGQDPLDFNTTFHLSQLEAEGNINAITNTNAYNNTVNPETIYVRVEKATEPTCFSTVNFDLIVQLLIDLEVSLPISIDLCNTDEFPELDATPQNPSVDLTLVTYEWVDGSGTVVGTQATFTPTQGDTYTVTITYPPCDQEIHSVEIIITESPVLDLGEDQSVCDGSSIEIIPTITGNTTGITYLWSTGETTPSITVSNSGDYTLEITVGPCVVSDVITISIAENPIFDLGEDLQSCFEENVVLDASPSNYDPTLATYEWSLDGTVIAGETGATLEATTPGNYSVVVTVEGCTTEDSITITPANDIAIDLGQDFGTCFDGEVILDATPSNYDPTLASYEWSLNGTVISGESTATLLVLTPGNYSVVVTVGACTAQDSISITPGNDIALDLGEDFETCFDGDVILDASPSNYDPTLASYEWSLNGTIIPEETLPTLIALEAGTYSVVVSVGPCTATDSITISGRDDLVVTVNEDFKTCPDEVQVLTAVTSETDVTYQWYKNGDIITGATASTLEIVVASTDVGEQVYSVTISVGDCSGSDEVSVVLYDVGKCTISQGLSPNGDGFNDCLDLEFIRDRTGAFTVEIFNRYGMSVFSQNNYVNEFCGVDQDGNDLPTGTYFYVMKFSTPDPVYGSLKTGWIYINKEVN
ncbi:MAG: gliding motility-associated C-terminal domain-containing protein [Flavobacteriaceae bacterium]